ncbi:MAG: HEAT repeat domain-containing protein [Acidobacteriota bacterium]
MTSGPSITPTAPDDALSSLKAALRDLAFAVKSLRLYPPTSPVVKGAIERCHRSLAPLLRRRSLHLEIVPGVIRVDGSDVGDGTPAVEQLSRRMHGLGIAKLHLASDLEPASLQALAGIVAREPQMIAELGGIKKVFASSRPRGVTAEFLELDRLFADSEEGQKEEDVWGAILEGYRAANDETEEIDWEALAQSVDRLSDFVGWLATNLDAVAERTGYENINVLRFVLDRLGSISSALTSDHVGLLVLAVRQAFDQFDPDVLVDLLADPVEIPAREEGESGIGELDMDAFLAAASGKSPGRKTIDIGSYIASGLDPDQAEQLILHTMRTRGPSTPRLYGLFERLTHGRRERKQMAEHIEEVLNQEIAHGPDRSQLLSNWPRLSDVLNGEAPQRFLSAEYETGLQRLISSAPLDDAWPIERVEPRLSEMASSFIALRKSLMVARLLNHEIDDASYRRLALELEGLLGRLLEEEQFRTLNKLLKELHHASRDADRSAARRDMAIGVVERFYTTEVVKALVEASVGRPSTEVEIIVEILRARGAEVIPPLLDAVADESRRRVRRRLLRILTDLGDEVAEIIVERFDNDDRWFVLRNLVMIFGEVGDASMVEHLSPMFEHSDVRVRQEAIAATIQLGGPAAEPLLMSALDDDDVTTRLMAIHGLGYHGGPDCIIRLRKFLAAPNFRGQNSSLIQVAAIALGRLGDLQSGPACKRLARRPWLFRARRNPARHAATWALEALRGESKREAPDARQFVDLKPGTASRRRLLEG